MVFTSFGVHDYQLFPEEHYALIHSEVAAKLNAQAEARGRPRPQKLAGADIDAENNLGRAGDDAGVEDENDVANIEVDGKEAMPLRSESVEYRARYPLNTDEVFDAVQRVVDSCKIDGRANYIGKLKKAFMMEHSHECRDVKIEKRLKHCKKLLHRKLSRKLQGRLLVYNSPPSIYTQWQS